MQDFLYEYLSRRFSIEQMRVEWGYNLEDACTRYAHDETIGLFQGVLSNEASDHIQCHLSKTNLLHTSFCVQNREVFCLYR